MRWARHADELSPQSARLVADVGVGSRARHIVGQTADTLRNTPLPAQRRLSKLTRNTGDGDVMDWLTRKVEAPDSDRYQRGLEYLRLTGSEGKQLLSRLTPDARSALLRMHDKAALQRQLTKAWVRGDVDPTDIGQASRRYDAMDADRRAKFESLMDDAGAEGAELLGSADDATLNRLLGNPDLDEDDLAATARAYADFDSEARTNFGETLGEFDDVRGIHQTDFGLEIEGERYGTDVTTSYSDEGASFYTHRSPDVNSQSDLTQMTSQEIGEEVVEGDVANEIIESREGYEIVYGQHKAGNAQGIDLIARDTSGSTDEFVVIEVKFTSQDERLNMGAFGERTFQDGTFDQMSDEWVEGSYDQDIANGGVSVPDDVGAAMRAGNYRKELFVVQDGQTGAITSESVANLMDEMTMLKTNGVTK